MSHTATDFLTAAALVVAGAMTGNETAVALVDRQLTRLDERTHARAARALAAYFGRVMPGWYALTLVLTLAVLVAARVRGSVAWTLTAAAAALFAATIGVTLIALVPLNNRIRALDVEHPAPGWRDVARRWDARHMVRVAVLLLAFALLAASTLAGGGR